MSNLSQGNLMRNPGSDIDLAALYNNDSSKSMGFSLPNVPWPSAAGQCQFGYGVSSWVAQNWLEFWPKLNISQSFENMCQVESPPFTL